MINKIHEVGFDYDGIIMNAGAYTHTSIALHDAIKAVNDSGCGGTYFKRTCRESFRHVSMISAACKGVYLRIRVGFVPVGGGSGDSMRRVCQISVFMGRRQRRRAQINADIINYQQNKSASVCVFCVICVQ